MYFVWISEQTAIISLYSINWLVCITREGVCLLRGTDWRFKYNPSKTLYLKGLVTVQAFNCKPLTAVTQVWFQTSPYEICGGTVALDRFVVELWHWTDLWWNCGTGQICGGTVALDRFIPEYFGFPPSYDSTKCSKLIFIYKWFSPEGKRSGAGDLPKMLFRKWRNTKDPALPTHRFYSFYTQHSTTGLPSDSKMYLCGVKIQFYI